MKPLAKLALALLILYAAPSAIAETETINRSPLQKSMQREVTLSPQIDKSATYIEPTLQHLSKLYWKLGVFDLEDNRAIDYYMAINECPIYTNHIRDDFEWPMIREAGKKSLRQKMDTFPTHFKFKIPVTLGDYDEGRGGFHFAENTGFPNLKRLEISATGRQRYVCDLIEDIEDYDENLVLIFDKPLDLTVIEVDDHIAQAYILRKNQEFNEANLTVQKRFDRTAYIVLKAEIKQYLGNIKNYQGNAALVYTDIDFIELYEDKDEKILLSRLTQSKNSINDTPNSSE